MAEGSEVVTSHRSLATRYSLPALVFVGSGELESALREPASGLGLRVIDRANWKVGESSESPNKAETAANALNPQPSTINEENCGTVFFYGFRQIEENPVFYALAEAFVLPSLKEEWGLVVNEAMACSLPVIVSRTAGCAEDLVPHAKFAKGAELGGLAATDGSLGQRSNGFVFDPKSCDALSEALRRIADPLNPKRSTLNAAAMGRRSREIVAGFSCENFARQALRAAEAASA
jgi:glycosyltransferase involved in cell wall biosynthesis